MTARQIELKRLVSEAKEMANRWGGLAAFLEENGQQSVRICNRVFTRIGVATESAETRLSETLDFLVRIKLLTAKERR